MSKMTYTNSRGQSIELAGKPFALAKVEGLGDVEADIQTQKAPFQDGVSYIDTLMNERDISFEVGIFGDGNTDISEKRQQLSRIFNPKLGVGTLRYEYGETVREIEAVAEHVPTFSSGSDNRGYFFQRAAIDLICPSPFWRSLTVEEEPAFTPLFEFPFEGSFEMGEQRDRRIINNDGDAPASLRIEFYGPAENPRIENLTTGEFIKINRNLAEGEFLRVDTSDDEKIVEFVKEDGSTENVFHWIDLDSTLFKLQIGENDIEYTADSNVDNAEFNIEYEKLYVSV